MIVHSDSGGEVDPREQFNLREKERITKEAARVRGEVIDSVFDAVTLFAGLDRITKTRVAKAENPKGMEVEYFVLEDLLTAPNSDSHRLLSLLLVRDDGFDQTDEDIVRPADDKLRVYLPIPQGFEWQEEGDLSELPKPGVVYIERISGEDSIARYGITREGYFSYISEQDSGEDVLDIDAVDERFEAGLAMRGVESGMPFLSKLQEDLINMKAIPQRTAVVGQPGVKDA